MKAEIFKPHLLARWTLHHLLLFYINERSTHY